MKKANIILTAILLANICVSQETFSVLDSLVTKLETYNQYFPQAHAYLQTDRDVYLTGDIIWFDILISENGNFTTSSQGDIINVNLYDSDGNLIIGDFYNLGSYKIHGDIKIPANLMRGLYYIAAILPSDQNASNVFTKPIYIDGFYNSDVLLNFPDAGKIYDASQDIEVPINIVDYQGNPAERFNLVYECYIGNEMFETGKERADRSGNIALEISMPEGTGKNPLYIVFSDDQNTWEKILPLKTSNDHIDIEFFPEGGSLISGINQNIGFIVKDIFGNYIPVAGNVIDNQGNLVTMASTITDGFGFFAINMAANETYRFEVTSEYGEGQIYDIPEVEEKGISLSIPRMDDQSIYANLTSTIKTPQGLLLTVIKGNSIEWATQLQLEGAGQVKIPTEGLPRGVLLVSVLDNNYNNLCNRIIYLESQPVLSFEIDQFETQDNRTIFSALASDESGSNKSAIVLICISDDLFQFENSSSLTGYFNLNACLEFPIPNAQSFIGQGNSINNALNYMLIANKLNGFSWEKAISFDPSEYDPLNPVPEVSGTVFDKQGNPYANAKISLSDTQENQLYSETADENGFFTFKNLPSDNLANYEITATEEDGRGDLDIQMAGSIYDKLSLRIRANALKNPDGGLSNSDKLSYVMANPRIVADAPKTFITAREQQEEVPNYIKMLQSGKSIEETIKTISGGMVYTGLPVSQWDNSDPYFNLPTDASLFIDGRRINREVTNRIIINPFDIVEIKISGWLNTPRVDITTSDGSILDRTGAERALNSNLYKNGLRVPRDFLSPETLLMGNNRTTVYWNPWLQLNEASGASFSTSLSNKKSSYSIRIEGIAVDGKGTGSRVFKVDNQ